MKRASILITLAALTVLSGCVTPRTVVRKNPDDCDTGIRFYRPKPYLLVTASGVTTKTSENVKSNPEKTTTKESTGISDRFVKISLEYLPDFSEEYSIRVRPGIGSNTTNIKLENGWNLTSVDQTLDSQLDENITALSQLASAAAGFVGTGSGGEATKPKAFVVQATNVPLGYYEAVIGGCTGKKSLYGWRYVGFAPFAGCPLNPCNEQGFDCTQDCLFGLVFRAGVMTFVPLDNIQNTRNIHPTGDPFVSHEDSGGSGATSPLEVVRSIVERLDEDTRNKITEVRISSSGGNSIEIGHSGLTLDEQTAIQSLASSSNVAVTFDP